MVDRSINNNDILSNDDNLQNQNTILDLFRSFPQTSLLKNVSSSSNKSDRSNTSSTRGINIMKNRLGKDFANSNSNQIVYGILKMIKKLNSTNHRKLSLNEFIDMVQNLVYNDVSLILMDDFKKYNPLIPQDHYLHYYMYFLKYAQFYHFNRSRLESTDTNKQIYHKSRLSEIKDQLQYMYNIIISNKDKQTEISL